MPDLGGAPPPAGTGEGGNGKSIKVLGTLVDLGCNNFDRHGKISRAVSRSKPTTACRVAASAQRSVKVLGHMEVRSL